MSDLPGNGRGASRAGAWTPVIFGLALVVFALAFPLALTVLHADHALACIGTGSFDCAAAWIRELGVWGILISILAMTLAALTMFPSEAAAMANGIVYGPLWGTALTWGGAMIGANLAYAVARLIGPHAIGLLLSRSHYERIRAWADHGGRLALLSARLIPLFPYFAVNYTAGLIGMRWWPFNWISALAMLPAAIVFTTIGASAGKWSWLTWLSVLAGIILLLWLAVRTVRRHGGRFRSGAPARGHARPGRDWPSENPPRRRESGRKGVP